MAPAADTDSPKTATTEAPEADIDKVLKLLADGEEAMKGQYGQTNATLVLGNTGAGKTTFTKWITDHDALLVSKADSDNLREFTIDDTSAPPKKNSSSFTSDATYPQLIINNNTGVAFYDFPGFMDTRGVANDIATTYFIKKVIDNVENVKMVCIVNYASFTHAGSRDDLKNMIQTATTMVKNFNKFQDSVLLVASKVNVNSRLNSYEQIVTSLVLTMKELRDELQREMDDDKVDNSKSIQFLDAVLRRSGDVYPYIELFRAPEQEGPLSEIPLMLENKRNVSMALEKFNYAPKNNADFGYVVPKQSLVDVGTMITQINQRVLDAVKSFGQRVHEYLYGKEMQYYDITQLYNETTSTHNKLIESKAAANQQTDPEKCVQAIIDAAIISFAGANRDSLTEAMKYANYSSFLHTVSNYPVDEPIKCADALDDVVEYSGKSRKWYKFLADLYINTLSTYKVQRDIQKSPCNELAKFVFEGGEQNRSKSSDVLEPYVKKCDPQHDYEFEGTTMDEPKFNALYNLLNLTMNHQVDSSCDSDTLRIKGQYIKLSDMGKYEKKCQTPPKFIQIFVADQLFFDKDLEKKGEIQLSVLARKWDVQGGRKIVLRGEPGKRYESHAASGTTHGQSGEKGKPGLPGNPAGHFYGVGGSYNGLQDLTVSSIGGHGGPGQIGGKGANGEDGADAYNDMDKNERYPKTSPHHTVKFYTKYDDSDIIDLDNRKTVEVYILEGEAGDQGGRGGDGGVGGKAGFPGNITFIPASGGVIEFRKETIRGDEGLGGDGGGGGSGGYYGRDGQVTVVNYCFVTELCSNAEMGFNLTNGRRHKAATGERGTANNNAEGIQDPSESQPFTNKDTILNEYKAYLRENLYHSVKESELKEFLDNLEGTKFTEDLKRNRRSTRFSTREGVDRVETRESSNFAANAAHNLNSPINTAINLIAGFFVPLKFIYPTFVTNYKSIKNSIESMLEESTSSQSNAYSSTNKLDEFSVNGAIALADYCIRRFTKVKPYESTEKSTNLSEIRADTLNMITAFETVLSHLAGDLNLRDQSFEFDPVSLISKLDQELIKKNYRDLVKILFESIDDSARLEYSIFKNEMQPRIDQMLAMQNELDLRDCCVGVDNGSRDTNQARNAIGASTDFNRIFYRPRLQENFLFRLE